jgi:hypothetical protein
MTLIVLNGRQPQKQLMQPKTIGIKQRFGTPPGYLVSILKQTLTILSAANLLCQARIEVTEVTKV